MKNNTTKAQLIAELEELREKNAELEAYKSQHKHLDVEFKKDKATLDNIINLNPYSISIYDSEGHYIKGNQAYLNLFDRTPPSPDYSIFDDPILKREGIHKELLKLKNGEAVISIVDAWYNPHDLNAGLPDKKVYIRGVAFPILDTEGKLENIVIMHEDLSRRESAEEELKKSEERYRELVENINEVIYSIDKHGIITYISPSVGVLAGYKPSDIIGRSIAGFFHKDDLQLMKKNFQEVMIGNYQSNEYRVVTKDGGIRWISTSSRPVSEEGIPAGIHGVLIDITERKKIEVALQESEEKYRNLAKMLPQTVFETDLEGNLTFSNLYGFETSGYTKEDFERGLNVVNLVVPEERETLKQNIGKILAGGRLTSHEYTVMRVDGSTFPVLIYSNPIIRDNKPVGLRGIAIDITERKQTEDTLRESEEQYRAIFNSAAVSFWEYDFTDVLPYMNRIQKEDISDYRKYFHKNPEMAHKIISLVKLVNVNETTVMLYGAESKEELIAEFGKHQTPESYNTFLEVIIASMEGKRHYSCETVNLTLDGRLINVLLHITYTYTFRRKNLALVTVTDITGRKQAEEALKKSDNLLRSALGAIPAMLSVLDRDFNILYSNWKGYADVCEEKRIIGDKCYKVFRNSNVVCPDCKAKTVLKARKPLFTEVNTQNRIYDLRIIPVFDEHGDVTMFLEYVDDITDRKHSEEALMEKEASLSEAELMAQFGSWDWKITQDTLEWSKGLCGIFGTSTERFNKTFDSFMRFVHPDDHKKIVKNVDLAVKGIKPLNYEHRIIRPDGSERTLHEKAKVTFDENGNAVRMLGVAHDITELKQLDAERSKADKLESVGILAGGIAHDFNNILTAIIGNVSLAMLSLDNNSEEYGILTDAEKACLQAKDLTKQLLTFSRGGIPEKETAHVSGIINNSAGFSLRGSNVKSIITVADDLWPADVDKGQINQVINNLLINADQAMPEGGIINIAAENCAVTEGDNLPIGCGNYVKISINDQGTGIPEEYFLKIFDPYFTTKQKGSGLGLATTYSIIHQHDGHISVDSELGVGTTFTIYLPASAKKVEETTKSEEAGSVFKGKILLMDDEETVLEVVSKMLTHYGNSVVTVRDGIEAIDLYKKEMETSEPFDIVILDLTVPGSMGGEKAVHELLKIDPEIRAIVSSGYSTNPVVANYKQYGFKGNISKPYKMKDLAKILNDVMSDK